MADYHILGDGVYGVGAGGMMEESSGMVNAGSYSHAPSVNAAGPAMIPSNMAGAQTQNPSALMQGMVPHQQVHQAQAGSQIAAGGMSSYHQAAVHAYPQSEVPQKLHQYPGYGSQLPTGNIGGQYVSGPRLHHLGDSLVPPGSQQQQSQQQQQAPPRTVMPNQMAYQNRNISGNHYGQQIPHNSTPSAQLTQTASQYPNQYGSVNHHQLPQHSVQQNSQGADMWQSPVGHTQVTRPCMSQTQGYSHQVSMMPSQHGNSTLSHGSLQMQGPRPSTPNQNQYVGGQDYGVQHPPAQPSAMQRQPAYNLNATSINQNGTVMAQVSGAPQSVGPLQQAEQVMSFPQGPYSGTSQAGVSRPHYNAVSSAVPAVAPSSQPHLIGQQMMNMRPMHQMGYSPVSSRVNSGQQHSGTLPPGSPARLQQYHPPFSPNTPYSSTAQPSPHHVGGETATPPHISLYPNSQSVSQAPTSPQYRNPFPSQVTQSPQHLTPTPPAESPMSQNCHTPDRGIHSSSTPQSQGSFSSPSATHMTSPGHGHSPGNSNAPSNSLQHLEQMVLPRMGSGPSTPTANNVSPGTPNTMMSHTSGVGGPYYGHLTPQNTQSQHHPHHTSTVGDNRPQPQSPAFSHVSSQPHPAYVSQTPMPIGQISPSVSNVPNSQSMQASAASVNTLCNPNASVDERSLQDSGPHNTSMTYPVVSKTNVMQGIVGPEIKNSSLPSGPPPSGLVSSMSNATPQNHMSSVSSATSGTVPVCSNTYVVGKTAYQPGTSATFEVQQIQQELQQLYAMPQNPECQEKAKDLQERLMFLQSQTSQKSAVPPVVPPPNVNNQPIPTPYPRSPMLFNPGNPSAYLHQQPIQPHTVHYNPQAQQPPLKQDTPLTSSHADFVIQDLNSSHSNSMCEMSEQDPVDNVNIQQMGFSTPPETVLPLAQVEKPDLSVDPYELNFNEEPPVKLKRRTPKSEPKEPKPKKPPKPKKSKKAKVDEASLPNLVTGEFPPENNAEENIENQENATPKKSKKRKAKEKDDKDPSEPKEPKPKKQRKKSPKQPKKPKEEKELKEPGDINNDDNNNENNMDETTALENSGELPEVNLEEADKELKDGKKKEVKDKKESKPKTPKTPGSSKEGKSKSSPKKKLPKIALKFTSKKKKKKRLGASSDNNSDMEKTPPPSPTERDGIQKRRSARNTMRKKYTDDIDLHLTDDETIEMDFDQAGNLDRKAVQVVLDNHTEDYMVVEKILAVRVSKKEPEVNNASDAENSSAVPEACDIEEYYVKYKNLSYIHCEWRTLEELEKGDRRFIQKVKRFKQKKDTINFFDFLEEDPFNPDYVEVDRVLDVNEIREIINVEETVDDPSAEKVSDSPEVKTNNSFDEKVTISVKESIADMMDILNAQEHSEKVSNSESNNQITTIETSDEKSETSFIENKEKDALQVGDTIEADGTLNSENVSQETTGEEVASNAFAVESKVSESAVVATSAEIEVDVTDKVSTDDTLVEESKQVITKGIKEAGKEDTKPESSTTKSNLKADETNVKISRHYLVKWRALTYEESTWELEDDVDRTKIEQFEKFKDPPPKEKWKVKKRPKYSEWNQIEDSPTYKGGNTLREYQLEGVNWLTFCWYNMQNCILADEMGLGKTIQSITFLNEIDLYGIPGPFLVIAPLSTIGNWQREFETWTDLNTITYHGSSPSRNMIQEYEMYWKNEKGERILEVYKFQVMITTFEVILTDCLELKSVPWRCVIIDEAHRLKNRNCKLLEGLRLLETEHRVLLTGTPLQNNVEELFSLLNFLEPNRFASTEAFLEEFGDLKTEAQVDKLKALLKPMMLRRLKEDVEKTLAPKEETVIEVELTNIQKKYYRAILERNFSFLTKGGSYSNMPNLMNTMMELRKCCIHPFLINGAEEQIIYDYRTLHEDGLEVLLNAMVQASGKLVLIDKLLPRLRANGHRVLVFSQMVRCLDILEDYMVQKRYPYERIDGRVRGNMRQAAIDRFCKPDSDRFVFLLCTRAGGLGINLTAADTVIIFDSDWNPQNDLQAQARCHRIGQSKAVKVYRLICRNTYEREMFDKASLKLGLDKAVLQSISAPKETAGLNQQMGKKEIEDLLRKGAYGALMDDDNAGDKFCEEDIDQILQRRTQVIQLESGTKGSTFSKASFASSSTRSDIEIDDPNFWEKWAKKANVDADELQNRNDLIIQEPRRRTQTRRFGTDDHMLDLSELDTSDEDDESVSTRTRASRRTSKGGSSRSKGKNRGRALDREREEEMMEAIAPGNWTRAECYKVEKGLLTFGWGRWDACIALGHFRRHLTHKDIEDISRIILLYCLLHYRGDEKIKGFIWDLISPSDDGEERIHRNHSGSNQCSEPIKYKNTAHGLSAPVPRGRKGKKFKKDMKSGSPNSDEGSEWAKDEKYNPEMLLSDESYKRHLNRHANRVLLRVRLLYYLKHEVIGDLHYQVFSGIPASEIPLQEPTADGEPPAPWWDQEADKSLLIGIYKHGFERYNVMRQDPTLCFLARCGPPDGAALLAELNVNDDELEDQGLQKDATDKEDAKYDKYMDDLEALSPASETSTSKANSQDNSAPIIPAMPQFFDPAAEMGMLHFPSVTDLNTRLRRIVTAYQRTNKKQEQRMAQKARKIERREKFEAAIRERELKKRELQQRKWSRREEADFYRTISSFGVEYNKDKTDFNWTRFRSIARLERKFDETLAEYFRAFYAMCKRVCGRKLSEDEEQLPLIVEPISEERASRCLQRIDLLSKIREEILFNPELDERLKLCQSSMDLPDWWQCGKHDKDLLIGAARHGLSRMDYHLLHDSDLSFKDVLKNFPNAKNIHICSHVSTPVGCSSPITACQSVDENIAVKEEVVVPDSVPNTAQNVVTESPDEKKILPLVTEDSIENKEPVEMEVEENQEQKTVVKDEIVTAEKPSIGTINETEIPHTELLKKESVDEISVTPGEEIKSECDDECKKESEESSEKVDSEIVDLKLEPLEDTKVEAMEETKIDDEDTKADDEETKVDEEETKVENENDEETDIEMDLTKEEEIKMDIVDQSIEAKPLEQDVESEKDMEMKVDPVVDPEAEEKPDMQLEGNIKSEVQQDEQSTENKELKQEIPENLKLLLPSEDDKSGILLPGSTPVIAPKDLKETAVPLGIDDSQECASQNDDLASQASFNLEHELGEPTVAQLLAITSGNSVRWPKDKVLQIRLEHVVHAIEKNEWPVIRHTFLPNFPVVGTPSAPGLPNAVLTASPSSHRASPVPSLSSQGHSGEATPQATPEHTPQREPILPDIPVPPSEFSILSKNPIQPLLQANDPIKHRRRRRRRRFEIEAERAKLRALLSHNMQQQQHHHQQQMQHVQQFLASSNPSLLRPKMWEDHADEKTPIPAAPSPVSLVTSASTNVPPPAHQNSSPRVATTIGSLDLRVKCSITPPSPFTPTAAPQKTKPSPIEQMGGVSGSPSSPMDLSATCVGTPTPTPKSNNPNSALNHALSSSAMDALPLKSQTKSKPRERGGAKGGSRIDALALNLQARKQKQMLQEQHHHRPTDIGSLLAERAERAEKNKELDSKSDEFPHHHQYHHHERRNVEEEEVKLRKKRLQYTEEALRKSASRAFDMTPAPAHSSFMNSSTPTSMGRLLSGSKSEDSSVGSNPILDHSNLMHHDFKKWLEDHPELVATNPNLVAAAAAAMAFSPVPSFPAHTELLELPEGRRRGRRPRLDPTKLDFDKITGEENVSVINRLTGKKITGSKAPPLKHLAEWLDKNPMFDVDPKWGPLVREKGNLPGNMTKRIITPSEKRGRRTAASLLASAHQNLVSPPTTMAFPSAGLNPLSFANAGMLTGFPNMKFFMDSAKASSAATTTTNTGPTSASTPPIFLPFGGLAGMGLTNPLFGFPGFNFQGLQGTPSMGGASASSSSKDHGKDGDKSKGEKNIDGSSSSSRSKNVPASSGSASSNISSTTSMPSATSLPFLYPAPGLLYNPLGLGGFTLPPNLPASFASLTQSGLVNGLGLSNPLVTTSAMGTAPSSLASALTTTVSAMSHGSMATPSVSKSLANIASNKHTLSQSLMEGQDSDDESLKSLMGNHDDDDDDFDDGKLEIDNLDRDDSDRESNRDSVRESPMFVASRTSTKAVDSESETLNLVKANSLRPSVDLKTNKSKSVSDDPTSDNTDTESKHS